MVLQVLAHAGRIVHDRDAVALEQRARAHTRKLQQLRRVDGAGGENHFARRARLVLCTARFIGDADRALALEQHAGRERLDLDAQVRTPLRRPQVADRRAAAPAVSRRGLVVARPFLGRAVEIVVARNAERHRRGDEGVAHLVPIRKIGHGDRAADAVPLARAAAMVLGLLEIRQQVVEAPAGHAPAVVVLALAADVNQAVDRGGAAQHLAARREHAPPVQRRLGLRLIGPVDVGAREQLPVAERHVDPEILVARPRLEQQHRAAPVGGEAVGEHAARRTRAYDDVVEGSQSHRSSITPCRLSASCASLARPSGKFRGSSGVVM